MLVAINYHYVRPAFDHPYPGIHGLTPAQFEHQIRVLSTVGTFVGGADIRSALNGGRLPERSLIVTFDDGLREQYDYAWPVLQRLGVPALLFVNTGPIAERTVSTVHKIHLLRSRTPPAEFLAALDGCAQECGVDLHMDVDGAAIQNQYPYDDAKT